MNVDFNKLDQNVYILVINIVSFLKTLQKKRVKNNATIKLSKVTNSFNKQFNDFYDNKVINDEIKQILIAFIEEIMHILIESFEDAGKDIINEKADLYILSEKIKKDLEKL